MAHPHPPGPAGLLCDTCYSGVEGQARPHHKLPSEGYAEEGPGLVQLSPGGRSSPPPWSHPHAYSACPNPVPALSRKVPALTGRPREFRSPRPAQDIHGKTKLWPRRPPGLLQVPYPASPPADQPPPPRCSRPASHLHTCFASRCCPTTPGTVSRLGPAG